MKLQTLALLSCVIAAAQAQPEFEVAVIRPAAPQAGHFAFPSSTGGPGTEDPTTFRCANCNLAFLITKAFALERYQFPGRTSLPETAFDVSAKVADGATREQFQLMLQALLKQRFNLTYHFDSGHMQGYELVVAKGGPKLKESSKEPSKQPEAGAHSGHGSANGSLFFNGTGRFRAEQQSTADVAQMLANQLGKPVDDHTGLKGKYDINLNWTDDGSHAATHAPVAAPGGWSGGGGGHGDGGGSGGGYHGGGGSSGSPSASAGAAPDLTLIGAVQAQLGLVLKPKSATFKLLFVDAVDKAPTAN